MKKEIKQLENKHDMTTINTGEYWRFCRQCGIALSGDDPVPFYGCSEKTGESNKRAAYLMGKYGGGLTVLGF